MSSQLFRVRPEFARKNLYMVVSWKLPRRPSLFLPLPLFVIDEMEESLALLWAIVPRRVLAGLASRMPYAREALTGLRALSSGYRELRWKGSFTLLDVNLGVTSFRVKFI